MRHPHVDPSFDLRTAAWERTVERALEAHFSRAERVALEKLTGAKSRKRYEAWLEDKVRDGDNDGVLNEGHHGNGRRGVRTQRAIRVTRVGAIEGDDNVWTPAQRSQLEDIAHQINERYTVPLDRVLMDPDRQGGGKGNDVVFLPKAWGDDAWMAKRSKEFDGLIINPTLKGTVVHEYGHILDTILARDKVAYKELEDFLNEESETPLGRLKRIQIGLEAPSPYGSENRYEWVAEAFADWWWNGTDAKPNSQVVGRIFDRHFGRHDGDKRWVPELEDKAFDRESIFDAVSFAYRLVEDAFDWIKGIFIDFGASTSHRLGVEYYPEDPSVAIAAMQQAQRLSSVAETTAKGLDKALTEGESLGESLDQIAERVRKEFETTKTVRIPLIATTEVMSAANTSAFQAAFQSGLPIRKTWITMGDAKVRDQHQAMQLVSVNLREPFMVPTGKGTDWPMDHPGDPSAPIGLVIHCRCRLAYTPVTTDAFARQSPIWRSRVHQVGTQVVKTRQKHPRPKAGSVAIVSRRAYIEAWNPKPQNWPDTKVAKGGDADKDGWADDGKPTMHWVGLPIKLDVSINKESDYVSLIGLPNEGGTTVGLPTFGSGDTTKKWAEAPKAPLVYAKAVSSVMTTTPAKNIAFTVYMRYVKDLTAKAHGQVPDIYKNAGGGINGKKLTNGFNNLTEEQRQSVLVKASTYSKWAGYAVDAKLGKPHPDAVTLKPAVALPDKPVLTVTKVTPSTVEVNGIPGMKDGIGSNDTSGLWVGSPEDLIKNAEQLMKLGKTFAAKNVAFNTYMATVRNEVTNLKDTTYTTYNGPSGKVALAKDYLSLDVHDRLMIKLKAQSYATWAAEAVDDHYVENLGASSEPIEADPELEKLLAEEEEIAANLKASLKPKLALPPGITKSDHAIANGGPWLSPNSTIDDHQVLPELASGATIYAANRGYMAGSPSYIMAANLWSAQYHYQAPGHPKPTHEELDVRTDALMAFWKGGSGPSVPNEYDAEYKTPLDDYPHAGWALNADGKPLLTDIAGILPGGFGERMVNANQQTTSPYLAEALAYADKKKYTSSARVAAINAITASLDGWDLNEGKGVVGDPTPHVGPGAPSPRFKEAFKRADAAAYIVDQYVQYGNIIKEGPKAGGDEKPKVDLHRPDLAGVLDGFEPSSYASQGFKFKFKEVLNDHQWLDDGIVVPEETSSWMDAPNLDQVRPLAKAIADSFQILNPTPSGAAQGKAAYKTYLYVVSYSLGSAKWDSITGEQQQALHMEAERSALAAGIFVNKGKDPDHLWDTFHVSLTGEAIPGAPPPKYLADQLHKHGPHVAKSKPHYDAIHKVVAGVLPNDANDQQRVIPTTELLPAWGTTQGELLADPIKPGEYDKVLAAAKENAGYADYKEGSPEWFAYVNAWTASALIKKQGVHADVSYNAAAAGVAVINSTKPDENPLKLDLHIPIVPENFQPSFDTNTGLIKIPGLEPIPVAKSSRLGSPYYLPGIKMSELPSGPFKTSAAQFAAKNAYLEVMWKGSNTTKTGYNWDNAFVALPKDEQKHVQETALKVADRVGALVEASELDTDPTDKVIVPVDVSKWPETVSLPKLYGDGNIEVPTRGSVDASDEFTENANNFVNANFPDASEEVAEAVRNAYKMAATAAYDDGNSSYTIKSQAASAANDMKVKLGEPIHPVPPQVLIFRDNKWSQGVTANTRERDLVNISEVRKKANLYVGSLGSLTPYERNAAFNAYAGRLTQWWTMDATAREASTASAEERARKAVDEVRRVQQPNRPTVLDTLSTPTISTNGLRLPDGTWIPQAAQIDAFRYPTVLSEHIEKSDTFTDTTDINMGVIHAFEMSGGNWENFTKLDEEKQGWFLSEIDNYVQFNQKFVGTSTPGTIHQPPLIPRDVAKGIKTVKKQKAGPLLADANLEDVPSISAYLAKGGRPDPNVKSRTGKSHALQDAFIVDLKYLQTKGKEKGIDLSAMTGMSLPQLGGMSNQSGLNNSDASLAAAVVAYDAMVNKGKTAAEAKTMAAEAALAVAQRQLPEMRSLVATGDKFDEVFLGRPNLDAIEAIDPKWGPLYAYSYVTALNVTNDSFQPWDRNTAGRDAVTGVVSSLKSGDLIDFTASGKAQSVFSGGVSNDKPLKALGNNPIDLGSANGIQLQYEYFKGGGAPVNRETSQAVKRVTKNFKENLATADEHFAKLGKPTVTERVNKSLAERNLPAELFDPEKSDVGLAYWSYAMANMVTDSYGGDGGGLAAADKVAKGMTPADLDKYAQVTKDMNPPPLGFGEVRAAFASEATYGNLAAHIYSQTMIKHGKAEAYKVIAGFGSAIGSKYFKKKMDEMFIDPTVLDPEVAKLPVYSDETFEGVYAKWSNATRYIKALAHGDATTEAQREAVYKEISEALPLVGADQLAKVRAAEWSDPDIAMAAYVGAGNAQREMGAGSDTEVLGRAMEMADRIAKIKNKELLKTSLGESNTNAEATKGTAKAINEAAGATASHLFLSQVINGMNDDEALAKVYAWDAKNVEVGFFPTSRTAMLRYLLGGDKEVGAAVDALHSILMKAWGSGGPATGHEVGSYDSSAVHKLASAVPLVKIITDKIDHWKGSSVEIRAGFRAGKPKDLAFVTALRRAAIVNPVPLFRGVTNKGYWDAADPENRKQGVPKVGQHILISGGASFSDSRKFAINWASGGNGYQIQVDAKDGRGFYIAPLALGDVEREWIVPHGEYEVVEVTEDDSGQERVKVKIVDDETKAATRPEVNYEASWALSFASFGDQENEPKPSDEEIQAMFDQVQD